MTQSGSPPPDDDEPSLGAVFVRNGAFLVVAARLNNALVTRVSELVNAGLDVSQCRVDSCALRWFGCCSHRTLLRT